MGMGLPLGQGRLPRFWVGFRSSSGPGSAPALLGGTLLLRYCAATFASEVPRVVDLVTVRW